MPVSVAAQSPRGRVSFEPFVGAIGLSDLGKIEGRLPALSGNPAASPERIINLTLAARTAPLVGATLGVAFSRFVELRASGAFAATEFDLNGISAGSDRVRVPFNSTGGLSTLHLYSMHADLVIRLAARERLLSPYVALGGGAVMYDMKDPADFFNVEPLTGIRLFPRTPRSSVAGAAVAGFGLDIRMGRHAALRFEAADAISGRPLDQSDFEMSDRFVGLATTDEVVHHFQARGGVSLRF